MSGERRTLANEFLDWVVHGLNAAGRAIGVRVEPDGTLRVWGVLIGLDSTGRDRQLGVDAAGRIYAHPVSNLLPVASATIPGSMTVFYTVPAGRRAELEVEFVRTGGANSVTAHAVFDAGAPAAGNTILQTTDVPATVGIRLGRYGLGPGGTVRASCAPANAVTIHVWARELQAGDFAA